MGRLTFDRVDGTWGVKGMHEGNQDDKMYLVAAKLHAYEKSGLTPSDLEDLCDIFNEYRDAEGGRLTAKGEDGSYYYPECFRRCDGLQDSLHGGCEGCDVEMAICHRIGRYEDIGLRPTLLADVAKILARAIPSEKKVTRAEKIRSLTDEELARLIFEDDGTTLSEYWCRKGCPRADEDTLDCGGGEHCVLKWLQEEVADGDDII